MYKNKNFIILSSVDWDTHKQLHHHLTNHLLDLNYKILFVENTGTRSFKITDIARVKNRLKNILRAKTNFIRINHKLTILSPLFIPFHFNFFFKIINNLLIFDKINYWNKKNNTRNTVLISFLPNPITENIFKNLNASVKIYFMADNMTINAPDRELIESCEKRIVKMSDYIFYTSEYLKKKLDRKLRNNQILSSGVNYNDYNLIRKPKKNKKFTIGYIGAIREIIDNKLILDISKELPDAEIILIGPELTNFQNLKICKNIKFLGKVSHKKIPQMLLNFDVGIIPYKVNKFTDSIYPLKLNEYLAAKLPVVSSNIKTVNEFSKKNSDIIKIAKNNSHMVDILKKIKNKEITFDKKKIKSIAKTNSWKSKFSIFDMIIDEIFFKKNFKKYSLKQKILMKINPIRMKLTKIIIVIIIFMAIFKLQLIN